MKWEEVWIIYVAVDCSVMLCTFRELMFNKWVDHTSPSFHMRQTFLHKHKTRVRMRKGRNCDLQHVRVRLTVVFNYYRTVWCEWQRGGGSAVWCEWQRGGGGGVQQCGVVLTLSARGRRAAASGAWRAASSPSRGEPTPGPCPHPSWSRWVSECVWKKSKRQLERSAEVWSSRGQPRSGAREVSRGLELTHNHTSLVPFSLGERFFRDKIQNTPAHHKANNNVSLTFTPPVNSDSSNWLNPTLHFYNHIHIVLFYSIYTCPYTCISQYMHIHYIYIFTSMSPYSYAQISIILCHCTL